MMANPNRSSRFVRPACAFAALTVGAAGLAQPALAGPDDRPVRAGEYLYRLQQPDGSWTQVAPSLQHSIAREWCEALLQAIRWDRARPTVHARNLYHVSAAMYDAWAVYDSVATPVFHMEHLSAKDIQAAREEAISYAAYRVLVHRFTPSVGAPLTLPMLESVMTGLGFDPSFTSTKGNSPAAVGNRIAQTIITETLFDGANETGGYGNIWYSQVNEPLFPDLPGNPTIWDPNRWQPLSLDFFVDQSGNPIPLGSLEFLSPEWGQVTPFALKDEDSISFTRSGFEYKLYHDQGAPPYYNGEGDEYYRWGFEMVVTWSSHLDPRDDVVIDISPNSFGNSPLPPNDSYLSYYKFLEGGDSGTGHAVNPASGLPYPPQMVKRGDYARILAEFWADGPASETPPGHWFSIMNYVSDHPLFEKRIGGQGPVLDDLEWDVKSYLLMGGSMHDVAISAWGAKGWYDYVRPISAIRYMADRGQSSDPKQPSYHPGGIRLYPGYIEVVTSETTAPGERHAHLQGFEGKIAALAWRGPDFIIDPATDDAGVGWILIENWWPYQRPTFVTPPFAGYVSGHSTFSRNAAEIMTMLTGSEFFPGGVGEFICPENEFLVFEQGPSETVILQWATYQDASDQTSMSRIWGGIHPPADDLPGRHMGYAVAQDAFSLGLSLFGGDIAICPADLSTEGAMKPGQPGFGTPDGVLGMADFVAFSVYYMTGDMRADLNSAVAFNPAMPGFGEPDGLITPADFMAFIYSFQQGCP